MLLSFQKLNTFTVKLSKVDDLLLNLDILGDETKWAGKSCGDDYGLYLLTTISDNTCALKYMHNPHGEIRQL